MKTIKPRNISDLLTFHSYEVKQTFFELIVDYYDSMSFESYDFCQADATHYEHFLNNSYLFDEDTCVISTASVMVGDIGWGHYGSHARPLEMYVMRRMSEYEYDIYSFDLSNTWTLRSSVTGNEVFRNLKEILISESHAESPDFFSAIKIINL